jgi:hypothetical protein
MSFDAYRTPEKFAVIRFDVPPMKPKPKEKPIAYPNETRKMLEHFLRELEPESEILKFLDAAYISRKPSGVKARIIENLESALSMLDHASRDRLLDWLSGSPDEPIFNHIRHVVQIVCDTGVSPISSIFELAAFIEEGRKRAAEESMRINQTQNAIIKACAAEEVAERERQRKERSLAQIGLSPDDIAKLKGGQA